MSWIVIRRGAVVVSVFDGVEGYIGIVGWPERVSRLMRLGRRVLSLVLLSYLWSPPFRSKSNLVKHSLLQVQRPKVGAAFEFQCGVVIRLSIALKERQRAE
ncbi:hypothetical protein Droror1_Dr00018060 [Drosera rotundifolia]